MQLDLNFVRDQFGQLADVPEFVFASKPGKGYRMHARGGREIAPGTQTEAPQRGRGLLKSAHSTE